MKYSSIICLLIITIISCNNKTKNTVNNNSVVYTNACCCNAIFDVGMGKIFVPSMFTPNNDGINDVFGLIGNNAVKYIYDVKIHDVNNNLLHQIDTTFGIVNNLKWNGYINQTDRHRGIFNVECKVMDTNNVMTVFNGQSCSFVCDTPANLVIPNAVNCKFESMFDPVLFSSPYASGETSCF